jgi:hypothetical protein
MLICSSLMGAAAVLEWPYLLRQAEAEVGPVSIMPRGIYRAGGDEGREGVQRWSKRALSHLRIGSSQKV